jgi:hypothetical protein
MFQHLNSEKLESAKRVLSWRGYRGRIRRLISTILLGCLLLIMLGISSFLFLDSGKTEGLATAGLAFGLVALVGG